MQIIVTIYTRKRTLTKPDRIDKVKTPRRELVDKFVFSGLYKDTQEMWEDVAYYIECTYKKEDRKLGRITKRLENRLKKIKDTKTYLMNQRQGIEAHETYKDKLTGCCQEGQVHHTLSERLCTDA